MQVLARWRDLSRLWWRDLRYGALNHHEKEKLSKSLPHAAEASLLETLRIPVRRPPRDVQSDEALLKPPFPSLAHRLHGLLEDNADEKEQQNGAPEPSPSRRPIEAHYLKKRREAIEAEFNAKIAVRRARLDAKLDEINSKKASILKSVEAQIDAKAKPSLFTPPARLEVPVIELSDDDPYWRRQERIEKMDAMPFPFPSPAERTTRLRPPTFDHSWWPNAEELAAYKALPRADYRFEEWRRVVWTPLKERLEELERRDKARLRNWFPTHKLQWNEMANFRRRLAEARSWGGEYVDDEEDLARASQAAEQGEAGPEGAMTLHDAIQILGLTSRPTKEELIEKRDAMKALNDPEKGGSAFLRDKVHVAADVVLNALERKLPFPTLANDADKSQSKKTSTKSS